MKVPGLRSSYEKVASIVFFGRMLDKIRLHAAGKLPPGYNLGVTDWSWFDARCTRFLGVDYPALVARVLRGGTDEEIIGVVLSARSATKRGGHRNLERLPDKAGLA